MTGSCHNRSGFSLVEVAVALGVAAFSLVVILGLLHTGVNSEKATVGQTVASGILSMVYADMMATPGVQSITQAYRIRLDGATATAPQTLYFSESGKPTGALGEGPTPESRYRASIGVTPGTPPEPVHIRILVTWPAQADSDPAVWPVGASDSVEVVGALERD